jgi:hypothetical protein
MSTRALILAATLLSASCSGTAAKPADQAPTSPGTSASQVSPPEPAPPVVSATPTATAEASPATPPSSGKVESAWKIGDKSLSRVDAATVEAALEKAGYGTIGTAGVVTCGDTETLQLNVTKKGKPVGLFSLQRPAAKPDACKLSPLKESYERWKPSAEGPKALSALSFDEPAGILLAINLSNDAPGAAKKLMDALVAK